MKILRKLLYIIIFVFVTALVIGCSDRQILPGPAATEPDPDQAENRILGEIGDTSAVLPGEVTIDGLGSFKFNPEAVESIRTDIFLEGYFSIFDVLVYLDQIGEINMEYYFDDEMNTYVISNLGGHGNWWYDAYYDGGWRERSVFRMDHYPYKDKMSLKFVQSTKDYLDSVYATYHDEIKRKAENEGITIIPDVYIRGKNTEWHFENVEVKAHNLRDDMFQPGVITAIDTIISLGEKGEISYDLQWYESIGTAGIVKSYWVDRINEDESVGRCGFVYEAGDEVFRFFRGNHNHIPSDIRVINSPQYVEYFWICI